MTDPRIETRSRQVRRMFDGIARRYDLLNHLLSANLDRRWRREAAREAALPPHGRLLDLCGGTGDLTLAVTRAQGPALAICCDFSAPMLLRARDKFERLEVAGTCLTLQADALRLPFEAGTFDAVTIAFGVRNLADLDAGFREMLRVLRPAGRLVVLEFSTPTTPVFAGLYRFYLKRLLPAIGDRIARRSGPYGYLARTIAEFPDAPTLAGRIRDAGFAACGWRDLTRGIVALHTAFKAA